MHHERCSVCSFLEKKYGEKSRNVCETENFIFLFKGIYARNTQYTYVYCM